MEAEFCKTRLWFSTYALITEYNCREVWRLINHQVNCPFILAPPMAAKAFYASISGSYPLPAPYSSFYAFPCLNPPRLHFEFGRAKFPVMHGGRGADWSGIPGGRFSLGRLNNGSGYCLGNVVETRMGVREERDDIKGGTRNELRTSVQRGGMSGNGMRDVWVIGEGFFRGSSAVFDVSLAIPDLF